MPRFALKLTERLGLRLGSQFPSRPRNSSLRSTDHRVRGLRLDHLKAPTDYQPLSYDTDLLVGYQRASPRQDSAGNWTTRRSPDDRKETQTAVEWSCFPFIRSGQNHLARHSERGKKIRQTEEEVGRQHQGMDRPEVRQVP